MRKFAVMSIVGLALASGSFVGASSASDEVVVARLTIESAPEADVGYAASAARSVYLATLSTEAADVETPVLGNEVTGTTPAPQDEEKVASAATVVPTLRPDFESAKSLTPEPPPATRNAQRRIVKVDVRPDRKRVVKLPVPVMIGTFR